MSVKNGDLKKAPRPSKKPHLQKKKINFNIEKGPLIKKHLQSTKRVP